MEQIYPKSNPRCLKQLVLKIPGPDLFFALLKPGEQGHHHAKFREISNIVEILDVAQTVVIVRQTRSLIAQSQNQSYFQGQHPYSQQINPLALLTAELMVGDIPAQDEVLQVAPAQWQVIK